MLRWIVSMMISSMIFFPDKAFYEKPEDYGLPFEDVYLQASDGVTLHGWYLKAEEEKGVILFFHGNAGNISYRLFKVKDWVKNGYSVFLLDYRGFGASQGKIQGEEDVLKDAQAGFKWLEETKKVALPQIILYGESVGTYPAIRLANEKKVGAIILEAPFTTFVELSKLHYPFVPTLLLKDFQFSNTQWIPTIQSPVFILHGTEDEICPYAMAERLFEQAPEPKEFFAILGGHHNDLPIAGGEDFWRKPYEFLTKHLQ